MFIGLQELSDGAVNMLLVGLEHLFPVGACRASYHWMVGLTISWVALRGAQPKLVCARYHGDALRVLFLELTGLNEQDELTVPFPSKGIDVKSPWYCTKLQLVF